MIHLNYLAATRISGPDARGFLQSQLSADIDALTPGQATFAAYCTPKGQVLGLLLVGQDGDGFVLIASSELLAGIVQRLKIYVMRSRVAWDEPGELKVLGLQAEETGPEDASRFTTALAPLTYALAAETDVSTQAADNWKSMELQLGVAWLDSATTESFIPQMLGEEAIGALSFNKGCYPGQEIVSRARYLGKVKRKPLIVTVPGAVRLRNASRVELVYPQESVGGTLIDSARTESGDTVLFIVTNLVEGQNPVSISSEERSFSVVDTGR
jgi:folate-binding protein YgfZ